MSSEVDSTINVHLIDPLDGYPGAHETLHVSHPVVDAMKISFQRTIRVPDNEKSYELPPSLGSFSIYSINQFDGKLPEEMTRKGGLLLPIYQREAMWIRFTAKNYFAVRVYVGGVNAISGESRIQDASKNPEPKQKSVQDYVVPGCQRWLDGIADSDGKVRQFVAVPVGTGYSVEAQITGQDSVAGIQFEIIPRKFRGPSEPLTIKMHTLTAAQLRSAQSRPTPCPKSRCWLKIKKEFRAIIRNLYSPRKYSLMGSTIHLVITMRGGGSLTPKQEAQRRAEWKANKAKEEKTNQMALAAAGRIKQTICSDPFWTKSNHWDPENMVLFNVQLFNAASFKQVLGIEPPPTPVSAETYSEHGLPFFELYEEPSGIAGSFPVQSIGALDKAAGANETTHESEKELSFPTIKLNDIDKSSIVWLGKKLKGMKVED